MELEWFCTGVLKVSHVCYMTGFCELLSWVSTKTLVGMQCLTINIRANRVVIVSFIITRIFLTLCKTWVIVYCSIIVVWFILLLFDLFICLLLIFVRLCSFDYFFRFNFHCSLYSRCFNPVVPRSTSYHHHLGKSINIIHQTAPSLS
jgi:hypothetical protein